MSGCGAQHIQNAMNLFNELPKQYFFISMTFNVLELIKMKK